MASDMREIPLDGNGPWRRASNFQAGHDGEVNS